MQWLGLIEREGVTVWNSVPAAMGMLLDYCEARRTPSAPTLRTVLLSGDWIPVTLPDRVRAFFDGADMTSLGGSRRR